MDADSLTGNTKMSVSHIHTWSHETWIFSYLSFENICEVFPSWNIEYCLFNIWKKCIHSPTRNAEFSHRFLCLSCEILYISIKKAWMKVFWYETWNSVYFTFNNLGRNVLIWNINSQLFTCETFSRFVHMKENFPSFRN